MGLSRGRAPRGSRPLLFFAFESARTTARLHLESMADVCASYGVVDGYGDRLGRNPSVARRPRRFDSARPHELRDFENRIVAARKRVCRLMAGQRILNPPFEGSIPSAPTVAVVDGFDSHIPLSDIPASSN